MIRALSDTAVLPIAGMILTFVLCYELIQLIIEKNNMHEFDTFNIYKWIFKTFVAVYILTHTFDIVMGVFSLAQNVVNASAGVISGSLEVNGAAALAHLETLLQDMGIWELIGLWLETNILHLCMTAITICIFLIIYGRMLEIYLTVSIAPIPLSTMANRDEVCCEGVRTIPPKYMRQFAHSQQSRAVLPKGGMVFNDKAEQAACAFGLYLQEPGAVSTLTSAKYVVYFSHRRAGCRSENGLTACPSICRVVAGRDATARANREADSKYPDSKQRAEHAQKLKTESILQ